MSRGPGRVQQRILEAVEEYRDADVLIWRGGSVVAGVTTIYLGDSILYPDDELIDIRGVARWVADRDDISAASFSRALRRLVAQGGLQHAKSFDCSEARFFRRSKRNPNFTLDGFTSSVYLA